MAIANTTNIAEQMPNRVRIDISMCGPCIRMCHGPERNSNCGFGRVTPISWKVGKVPDSTKMSGWQAQRAITTSVQSLWNNQSRWNTQGIPEECLVATQRHSERHSCSLF